MKLIQIIKDPTRISKSANTLIDHKYVSKDLPIIQSMPIEYSVSDHYPVSAVIDLKNNLPWCANDTHKTIHSNTIASIIIIKHTQMTATLLISSTNISLTWPINI